MGCYCCKHFEGPERWPDTARTIRCVLHKVPLVVQLLPTGYMGGEWFCRDFQDGGKAHPPSLKHMDELRGSLKAGVLYELGRGDNLGEHAFEDLPRE